MKEQESLCMFCPKCRDMHPPKECPLNLKETNKCAICAEDHITEKCPSIPGLNVVFTGGQPEAEYLYAMGARRNWPQVGIGMAPKFSPHYFGYNSHAYSYPNTNQKWQYGNQYQHGQPSQPWQQGWRGPTYSPYSYQLPMQSYPSTHTPYSMP